MKAPETLKVTPDTCAILVFKIGKYRTFYEVTEGQKFKVLAIGYKEHNELSVQGRKVQI